MRRPITPQVLKDELDDSDGKGGPINDPSVWAVCVWFKNRGLKDSERHAMLKWLTGDPSTKSLSMSQVGVLAEWLTGRDSEPWVKEEIESLRSEMVRQ